jgi:hypothetical protein
MDRRVPVRGAVATCKQHRRDAGRFRVAQADLRESARNFFWPRYVRTGRMRAFDRHGASVPGAESAGRIRRANSGSQARGNFQSRPGACRSGSASSYPPAARFRRKTRFEIVSGKSGIEGCSAEKAPCNRPGPQKETGRTGRPVAGQKRGRRLSGLRLPTTRRNHPGRATR